MAETIVNGTDEYGNSRYKSLYEEIMYDVGKLTAIDSSYLLLRPEEPLFIVSVKLRAKPSAKKIGDVAATRAERGNVYISIRDEMYAPGMLRKLWEVYGRDHVQQTDRLDITVEGPDTSDEVDAIPVESTEQPIQDILGSLARVLPEGIRNRRVLTGSNTVTIMATEEIVKPEQIQLAEKIHQAVMAGRVPDV
ncbi:MAG: methanogenesis marker 17 protein [Methanomethylophilus sp.]|jgi:putative methanogenesis marker protein 17